jgi:hypothetical protein
VPRQPCQASFQSAGSAWQGTHWQATVLQATNSSTHPEKAEAAKATSACQLPHIHADALPRFAAHLLPPHSPSVSSRTPKATLSPAAHVDTMAHASAMTTITSTTWQAASCRSDSQVLESTVVRRASDALLLSGWARLIGRRRGTRADGRAPDQGCRGSAQARAPIHAAFDGLCQAPRKPRSMRTWRAPTPSSPHSHPKQREELLCCVLHEGAR